MELDVSRVVLSVVIMAGVTYLLRMLPVTIFSLTDRGNIADGSALTIVLVGVTLLLMIKLERIARRMSQR